MALSRPSPDTGGLLAHSTGLRDRRSSPNVPKAGCAIATLRQRGTTPWSVYPQPQQPAILLFLQTEGIG